MRFQRAFLNRLHDDPGDADTVVVIDVLRSFTTAAVALSRGARAVYPVDGSDEASAIAAGAEPVVSVGSVGGGDPAPGFDYGNSPSRLAGVDLAGKVVAISTAAGVRGLRRFQRARRLYAASLVCARATADAIRAAGADEVLFVVTGEWIDRDGDEDVACADYLESMLRGEPGAPAEFARRVRDSDFGRRFAAGTWPNLPPADLDLAARADLFPFAMEVGREGASLVIR